MSRYFVYGFFRHPNGFVHSPFGKEIYLPSLKVDLQEEVEQVTAPPPGHSVEVTYIRQIPAEYS